VVWVDLSVYYLNTKNTEVYAKSRRVRNIIELLCGTLRKS